MTPVFTPEQCFKADLIIPQGADFDFMILYTQKNVLGNETLVDTSDYTAKMSVRDGDTTGDLIFSIDQDNFITLGWDPTLWLPSTAYGEGQLVMPTAPNGIVYESQGTGTSGATEPAWDPLLGSSTDDGTVLWSAVGTAEKLASNIIVSLPANFTGGLSDWGKGVYTLKVFNETGHTALFLDGKCHLRTEATYA